MLSASPGDAGGRGGGASGGGGGGPGVTALLPLYRAAAGALWRIASGAGGAGKGEILAAGGLTRLAALLHAEDESGLARVRAAAALWSACLECPPAAAALAREPRAIEALVRLTGDGGRLEQEVAAGALYAGASVCLCAVCLVRVPRVAHHVVRLS